MFIKKHLLKSGASHMDRGSTSQKIHKNSSNKKYAFFCFLLKINSNVCDLNTYIQQYLVLQGYTGKLYLFLLQNRSF